ncbi:Transcriptional regulator gntR family protein [Candidatus Sulfopaludibacter sp. SbA3]|nr:Transcriptional regulator gntR family protein [Candidatus Sulfopaludibacter sp. SbA3]
MPPAPRIRIDLTSPVPAYRQIVDSIRVLLVEGALTPGSQLPSVRRLAMELGVHFNTVGEAYRELAGEGWLDLRHGSGATVISRGATPSASPELLQDYRNRLRNLIAQMRSQGIPASKIAAELRTLTEGLKS